MRLHMLSLIALLAFNQASAVSQTTLEWKFSTGEVFFSDTRLENFTTVTVRGLIQPQELNQRTVSRFEVGDVLANGTVVLDRTVVSVSFAKEEGVPEAKKLIDAMKGMKFRLHFDTRQRKIVKLEGYAEFIGRFGKVDPNAAKELEKFLPPEAVIASLESEFFHTPVKPVTAGDVWSMPFLMPMGPLGKLQGENQYRLASVEGALHSIAFTTKATFAGPTSGGNQPGGLAFQTGKLEIQESTGKVVFDATRGRIQELSNKMKFSIKLAAESRGEQLEMALSQTLQQSTKFLDKNPLESK